MYFCKGITHSINQLTLAESANFYFMIAKDKLC